MIPPCEGCLLVPLCKHRDYIDLFDCCSLLKQYIPSYRHMHIRNEVRVKLLDSTLQSTKWKHDGAYRVINIQNQKQTE